MPDDPFITGPHAAQITLRRQRAWEPTTPLTITENITRLQNLGNIATVSSGRITVTGGLVLPARKPINAISFCSMTTAVITPTNQWFCLIRLSDLAVLVKTVDDTSTAWAANSIKTLATSAPYVPTADTPVYGGIVVVAATTPSLGGVIPAIAGLTGAVPVIGGFANTGLTTPASLGASISAPTNNPNVPWCAVS